MRDGCEKGTQFANVVDGVIDNLKTIKDNVVLLKLPAYAHLTSTFDKFIACGVLLSEESKKQVVQEDCILRRGVGDLRDAQFGQLLIRMEAIKDQVQDKQAFRTVRAALLTWLCEREIARDAAETDTDDEDAHQGEDAQQPMAKAARHK